MSNNQYIAAQAPDALERERLALLDQGANSISMRYLQTIGLAEGWHCLDVGAGSGSLACLMAERVGPLGQVVATDINLRFLTARPPCANMAVRQHDVVTDELETDAYDLVHCRALLANLRAPEQALTRMAAAVCPGGWLVIEEPDFTGFGAADPRHPFAEKFTRTYQALWSGLLAGGIVDVFIGRRLRSLVEGLGFVDVSIEGTASVHRGGEPATRFFQLGLELMKPQGDSGMITLHDWEELRAVYEDPAFTFVGGVVFGIWARRPS